MSVAEVDYRARLREALVALKSVRTERDALLEQQHESIAIVGMACRFPGGGRSPEAYWDALRNGVDAVVEIPSSRWPPTAIPMDRRETRWAALLENITDFDASFFGISPREAASLDPQQRLLLEISWEALEDAGQIGDPSTKGRTGVFVGMAVIDYQQHIVACGMDAVDTYAATGNLGSTAAGRISYTLGLQGPCVTVDTACSSSLVAVHLAVQSLRNRECDVALAGGVSAIISPYTMAMMAQMNALSPDGRCKTFDGRANGYVRGEGCGIIVLKRLADAVESGDRIFALIRGSAVNQDGRSTGLTTPNVLAQQSVLRQALANARVDAADIGYVETHGTGTALGDPIEVDALKAVLGKPRANGQPCALGAVKTNIGHLEGAAGIAGIIKAVQCVRHGEIPANLHFRALNPRIEIDGTSLVIPTQRLLWTPGNGSRIAGISGFGVSGTNAHVILENAPFAESKPPVPKNSAYLLPLSAKSPEALSDLAHSYAKWCSQEHGASLQDTIYTASVRRTHHEHRLAAVAESYEEFTKLLQSFVRGEQPAGVAQGRTSSPGAPRIVFVFPGQGSQWLGMGRQLLVDAPAFREALEACESLVQREGGFSIIEQLAAGERQSRLHEIDVVQPLLFAIEVALAKLWRSWGIEPSCVIGHSMGEVAAAHVAGMLGLDDAAKIICRRSRLLKRISGRGAMALVELPMAEAEGAIDGYETQLSVAVSNGPRSTVISGDPAPLEKLLANLEGKGIFCRRVKVDVASHSPQVEPLLSELRAQLADVHPVAGQVQMQSTVTGKPLSGRELVGSYWLDNLRKPVRFSQVTQDLMRSGHDVFIEMSPHPILLPSIQENLKWLNVDGQVIASMRRQTNEQRTMLEGLGTLHVRGTEIDWSKLFPIRGRVTTLPRYPWQRERYWIDAPAPRTPIAHFNGEHPLLGVGLVPASQPRLHLWEQKLSLAAFPYLGDHRVQGEMVFPGAGYVEMVLAAAKSVFGDRAVQIEHLAFEQMLALAADEVRFVQVSVTEEAADTASIAISSRREQTKEWVRHVSGSLRFVPDSNQFPGLMARHDVEARCPKVIEPRTHYDDAQARGISFGTTFRGLTAIRVGNNEAVARVRIPEELRNGMDGYLIHPAMLDAYFQGALQVVLPALGKGTIVPTSISAVQMHHAPGTEVWIHAQVVHNPVDPTPTVTLLARDENGRVLLEVGALRFRLLDSAESNATDPYADCIFEVAWQIAELDIAHEPETAGKQIWMVVGDTEGIGTAIANRLRESGDRVVEVTAYDEYAQLGENAYRLNPTDLAQWGRMLQTAFGRQGCQGVIDCLPLDGATFQETTEATLAKDLRAGTFSALRLAQTLLKQGWRDVPRLYVLTRGAQAVDADTSTISVSQSTIWGLGRVIAMEHPDMGCVRIDLPPKPDPDDATIVTRELTSGSNEDQIAYRRGRRYVARLVRGHSNTNANHRERLEAAGGRPYCLSIHEPGVLERLTLRAIERRMPGRGEVEIEVEAAGMNFLDVLLAMGVVPDDLPNEIAPGPRLGGECAGRIVRVGEGVSQDLAVGQEVIALAPGAMATHVIAKQQFVIAKPANVNWCEGASMLSVFLTAFYALSRVAVLRKNERVLIHAGAGGVGLAAIQWALHVGAEVFATAGSDEKRDFLRNLGVHHALDSRSLSFVADIRRITNGEGIDVVLNSLSGKLLDASLDLLRDHGRFVEIGKRDYYENRPLGLRPFLRNLSFTLVDFRGMMRNRIETVAALLHEVINLFAAGVFKPLPYTAFSMAHAVEAFGQMAQGRHTGKLAFTVNRQDARISVPIAKSARIRSDGTYLITGGLSGLGLSLAGWMVGQGARHIVLVGRNSPGATAQAAITIMQNAGATVRVMQANVVRRNDVDAVITTIRQDMPPLLGVVHAAAVIADRTVPEMEEREFFQAIEPKVFGAWNLHEATRNIPLDFFVLYSSGAGILGSPGQVNYAAANTFVDGLSHARVAAGLPSMSIQWGAFAEVGLAAASDNRGGRFASRGIASFSPADGNELFGRSIASPRPELSFMHFNVRQWVEFYPQMAGAPFVTAFAHDQGKPDASQGWNFLNDIERLTPMQRQERLESHLREQVGKVLRLDSGKIDKNTPFTNLGIDSLMSLELRNRMEASSGLKLSATLLFTYPTTATLAAYLDGQMFPARKSGSAHNAKLATRAPQSDVSAIRDESVEDRTAHDEPDLLNQLEAFEEYLK